MQNITKRCPICNSETAEPTFKDYGDKANINCPRCGEFTITRTALAMKAGIEINKPHLISHYLRKEYDLRYQSGGRYRSA